jgi:hypothetical protein
MATKDITDVVVCSAFYESAWQRRSFAAMEEESPLNVLIRMTDQPRKVCQCAIERALKRGFINGDRLTDKGHLFLRGQGKS